MRTIITTLVFSLALSASTAFAAGEAVRGKVIYDKLCASCHGATGRGDGTAAASLNPKPRDFSRKADMDQLTDAYLKDVISKGGIAVGKSAAMPPWSAQLKGATDLDDVIAHLRTLGQ